MLVARVTRKIQIRILKPFVHLDDHHYHFIQFHHFVFVWRILTGNQSRRQEQARIGLVIRSTFIRVIIR